MSLTDGDVALLARRLVDEVDASLHIEIEPADSLDPYRFGAAAWTVSAGGTSSYLTATMSEEEATAALLKNLRRVR